MKLIKPHIIINKHQILEYDTKSNPPPTLVLNYSSIILKGNFLISLKNSRLINEYKPNSIQS